MFIPSKSEVSSSDPILEFKSHIKQQRHIHRKCKQGTGHERKKSLESLPHTEFSGGRYPDITTKLKSDCFDINFIAKIPSYDLSIDSFKYSSKTEFLINIPTPPEALGCLYECYTD